jgi:Helix-destabilising protein
MIKVTVTSTDVRRQQGVGKVSGKAYDMSFQTVWMHTFGKNGEALPYPEKVEIILEKDKDGAALFHAPGEYQLHPSSIYVDARGNVAVAPRLVAMPKPRPAA